MLHLLRAYPGMLQTPANRLCRKPGPVLDPIESFFFHRSHQLPIHDQGRRSITVERVNTENVHKAKTTNPPEYRRGNDCHPLPGLQPGNK